MYSRQVKAHSKLIVTALTSQCQRYIQIFMYIFNSGRNHVYKNCDLSTEISEDFCFSSPHIADVDLSACFQLQVNE